MWHGQDHVAVFSDVIRYVTQCPPWEDMRYCLCSKNISEHLRPSYVMSAESGFSSSHWLPESPPSRVAAPWQVRELLQ